MKTIESVEIIETINVTDMTEEELTALFAQYGNPEDWDAEPSEIW